MDNFKPGSTTELIKEIVLEALTLPESERNTFLRSAIGGNMSLQSGVDAMLAAHAKSARFFDKGLLAIAQLRTETVSCNPIEPEPRRLNEDLGIEGDHFKILQKIGEGGCGMVYMAEQEKPIRRRVALKVIKLGMDTKSVVARFDAERQALAMMDHLNIARVFEAGATRSGRPYFVMELVKGIRITDYCDQNQLDTRERLELFLKVCNAIQHAHQKGIIHRDIKPSNILVTLHDGVPVPKVIDFGIAKAIEGKLTDQTLFTAYEHFIGTPAYMSPEQAIISGLDVDTRSDIYSLGVLLYELLTGRTPFETEELMKEGLDEWRRALREKEPQRPSVMVTALRGGEQRMIAGRRHAEAPQLISMLKGDLDWIVMKALEKDRQRRYETANGLGMDVRRYLSNEPVVARPPSRVYRLQKLVRRNWGIFAAGAAVVAALVAGLGISTVMFFKARESGRREMLLRQQAEARAKMSEAVLLTIGGNFAQAAQLLEGVSSLPANPSLDAVSAFRSVGEFWARQGQWQKAAKYSRLLIENDKFDDWDVVTLDYQSCGVVLAESGDRAVCEQFRKMAIVGFSSSTNADAVGRILKTCLFQPVNEETLQELKPLGDAVERWTRQQDRKTLNQWSVIPVSLWKFRCGDGQIALDYCQSKLDPPAESPACLATIRLIAAMIHRQRDESEEAKADFILARDAIHAHFYPELQRGDRNVGMWYDWIAARILLREAADKLGLPVENAAIAK